MDPELLAAATRVLDANRALGRRVVSVESCTGGIVAAALTEIAGASDVFERGFVTYSNDAKLEAVGVNQDILETFGAVSIAVAWAMAQGGLVHSHADIAVAVTGIAGPGGGSAKKPVGTVVFARATRDGDPDVVVADVRHFGDLGRSEIRRQAALVALELLMPEAGAVPVPASEE
ncbi:competence protein [alpha proteobacterium AAP81b]|nr:competence protein [alpha proteobacterium AAP81b]